MSYRELVFTVVAETAEPLGDALLELGALSVTVEDDSAGGYDENPLYGEPGLSPEVQAWDRSSVTALFNPDIDSSASAQFIPELLASLKDAGFKLGIPEEKIVEEQDWVRLTQSQFAPIQVGKRIWVVPSWHEAPTDPNAICLAVDPGLAFGTGSHPTTHLCLLWLEEHQNLTQHSLLDYGCGSGIWQLLLQNSVAILLSERILIHRQWWRRAAMPKLTRLLFSLFYQTKTLKNLRQKPNMTS